MLDCSLLTGLRQMTPLSSTRNSDLDNQFFFKIFFLIGKGSEEAFIKGRYTNVQ